MELYNLEIERGILNAVFYNPFAFDELSTEVSSEDFFNKDNKNIFKAFLEIYNSDGDINHTTVSNYLKSKQIFKEDIFLDIISSNVLPLTKGYLGELKNYTKRRKLFQISNDIRDGLENYKDLDDLTDSVEKDLYRVLAESTKKDFREVKDILSSTMSYIKDMKSRGNTILVGLDTGFTHLNLKTAGFGRGDLVIIAARPSMGKTAFALNIAYNLLNHNLGVAIFSLEMPAEQLMLRMLSAKSSIPLQDLRIGNLNDFQWSALTNEIKNLESKTFFVDDDGSLSISILRKKVRKLKSHNPNISMIIIDYLQLMVSTSANKDRHQEVADISRGLKLLARELEVPIIALSQLNRSLEARLDKRPMMSDIRESGAIEQDADLILFVYRDDVYKAREEREKKQKNKDYKSDFVEKDIEASEIIIAKNRNGPIGTIHLDFHKNFTRFVDTTHIDAHYEKPTKIEDSSVGFVGF